MSLQCPETLGAQFCIEKCSITYYCFVDQEKTSFLVNYCKICQHFWHLWMIFDYLFNSNGLKHSKVNLFHAEYSIDIQKLYANTVFPQLSPFGTFSPFLATFGIEIDTRC